MSQPIMMATAKEIGYWARVHDLAWADVVSAYDGDHEDSVWRMVVWEITGPDERRSFQEGWDEADAELRAKRAASLRVEINEITLQRGG